MAYSWSALLSQLQSVLTTNWPDIVRPKGGGVWEVDKIARIDFSRMASDRGAIRAPYAVIEWGPITPSELTITGHLYETVVGLHYLTRFEAAGNGLAVVRQRIETLEDLFSAGNTTPLLTAQDAQIVTKIDWSGEHAANSIFLQQNLPWVAGGIWLNLLVGET